MFSFFLASIDIHRFTIISYRFSEFWLVGPLQLSFSPLAQTSRYASGHWHTFVGACFKLTKKF